MLEYNYFQTNMLKLMKMKKVTLYNFLNIFMFYTLIFENIKKYIYKTNSFLRLKRSY